MSKTYTPEELRGMKSRTDIAKFKRTTEKEIRKQSVADPDTPYLTDSEIKEFQSVDEGKGKVSVTRSN
ncbi:hypothetical protein [Candidatus Thiosymbion oneisti]|uniref:hypothetical protein n=1 Tax=Candidatus Thiosymbion oneisti TaxID=589554 RepID=UPI00114CF5B5|nr:hypothetical protein [Candidatus Thiosymbion oneisti]